MQCVSEPRCELGWDVSSFLGSLQAFLPMSVPARQQAFLPSLCWFHTSQRLVGTYHRELIFQAFLPLQSLCPSERTKLTVETSHFFPWGNWIQTLAHLCKPVIKSAVQVTSATGSGDRQNEMWKKWHLFLGWPLCFSERKVLAATQWSPCDRNTRASSGPASWLQNSFPDRGLSGHSALEILSLCWWSVAAPRDIFLHHHLRFWPRKWLTLDCAPQSPGWIKEKPLDFIQEDFDFVGLQQDLKMHFLYLLIFLIDKNYIYTCIHIYVYISIHTHVYTNISCTHIRIYAYVRIRIQLYMYVYIYICIYIYIVCVCVWERERERKQAYVSQPINNVAN
jgi:hypothetical protein